METGIRSLNTRLKLARVRYMLIRRTGRVPGRRDTAAIRQLPPTLKFERVEASGDNSVAR